MNQVTTRLRCDDSSARIKSIEASYYRARYYDPSSGRFLREDPLGFKADTNFYRYVASNPTTRTDPFGLQDKKNDGGWFWPTLNRIFNKLVNPPPPKPGAPQPNPVNICEKGQTALFSEPGPNPYYHGNAGAKDWSDFQEGFRRRCRAAEKPGMSTTPYCTQAAAPGGVFAYCTCCESGPCESKK
jgi:RHS repeat-associated protein